MDSFRDLSKYLTNFKRNFYINFDAQDTTLHFEQIMYS